MRAQTIGGLVSLGLALANTLLADTSKPLEKPLEGVSHTFLPERREFSEERLKQLKVPPGFKVNVYARGLGNPRMIAVGDDNTVYVTCHDQGTVVALRDKQD